MSDIPQNERDEINAMLEGLTAEELAKMCDELEVKVADLRFRELNAPNRALVIKLIEQLANVQVMAEVDSILRGKQ